MTETGDLRLRNDNLENVWLEDVDFNITILKEDGKKLYGKNEYLDASKKFKEALKMVPVIKVGSLDLQYNWRSLLNEDRDMNQLLSDMNLSEK